MSIKELVMLAAVYFFIFLVLDQHRFLISVMVKKILIFFDKESWYLIYVKKKLSKAKISYFVWTLGKDFSRKFKYWHIGPLL